MPKVMFLAAVAKPHPEYGFDGKIGIWPFVFARTAQRNCQRTGTVAGVTMILEDVKVDAEEYRKKITGRGGVFDCMREKMPWFKEGSGKPEAGAFCTCSRTAPARIRLTPTPSTLLVRAPSTASTS